MPSALAPARCSEATPDELEQRLRFTASQIKILRTTGLLYSSPELMERIRQIEMDYETAVRLFYCRPPSPTPSHMSCKAAHARSPGLQSAAAEQSYTHSLTLTQLLLTSLRVRLMPQPLLTSLRVRPTPQLLLTSLRVRPTPQPLLTPLRFRPTPQLLLTPLRFRPTPQLLLTSLRVRPTPQPLLTSLRVRPMPQPLLMPLRVRQAPRLRSSTEFLGGPLLCSVGLHVFGAGPVARLNSVPAGDDLLVARLNSVLVSGPPAKAPTAHPVWNAIPGVEMSQGYQVLV
ncbi:hypothetical protein AMECASPLE_028849 [Ameca splendens]|uniref:Uncharacterized protein n=1 Tax=Ameca splendens TaxID=208324 RepID=A0ABV0YGN9_9TELE